MIQLVNLIGSLEKFGVNNDWFENCDCYFVENSKNKIIVCREHGQTDEVKKIVEESDHCALIIYTDDRRNDELRNLCNMCVGAHCIRLCIHIFYGRLLFKVVKINLKKSLEGLSLMKVIEINLNNWFTDYLLEKYGLVGFYKEQFINHIRNEAIIVKK